MSDFNLHRNSQGAWEWEHDGQAYGTDPCGDGIWRKLSESSPHTVPLYGRFHPPSLVMQEWEQITDRDHFHLPADRTGAINHLMMYYGV